MIHSYQPGFSCKWLARCLVNVQGENFWALWFTVEDGLQRTERELSMQSLSKIRINERRKVINISDMQPHNSIENNESNLAPTTSPMPLLPSSLPTSFSRINLLRPLILKLQRTDILLLGRLLLSNKCRQRTHTRLSMRLEEENARIPLGQHPRFIIFLRHWIRDLIVIRPPLECG